MIEDIEEKKWTADVIQHLLTEVDDMQATDAEKRLFVSEITRLGTQFQRIEKTSKECLSFIEEIEPIAKELNNSVMPVDSCNGEINDLLAERPVMDVDITVLEDELKKIEASSTN